MPGEDVLISVVIVNYRVPLFLRQTIRSLMDAALIESTEIIVVDNASHDGSQELIGSEFPDVQWIGLKSNVGFGKACNVGARAARGAYLLLLNPDTIVSKNTLSEFVRFMEERPDTGLVGPKILNPDGSLQGSCRRGFPTPAVTFYHFSGLSRLFPRSRRFGRYNLTYLDPDQTADVDAISGSCMFLRLSLFTELGGFDEQFFMYGEDLDLCARVKERGFAVCYDPATQIIHFKGRSSPRHSIRTRLAFYQAMVFFSEKYHHTRGSFFPGWVIYLGILVKAFLNISGNLFHALTACFIDLFVVNAVMAGALVVRFLLGAMANPYQSGNALTVLFMHLLISGAFLLSLAYRKVYTRERYSTFNTLVAGAIASVVFIALLFFLKSMAFSRIALGASAILTTICLAAWREFLPRLASGLKNLMYATGRVIILGSGDIGQSLIERIERERTGRIVGVIWPHVVRGPAQFGGYPVLGTIEETAAILGRTQADLLLVATAAPWYSYIIEALASSRVRNLTIRWVPHDLVNEKRESLPGEIPLHDFSV